VPGRDRRPDRRVRDAVRGEAGELKEHLLQAARDHQGEKPAATGTGGDVVPCSARHQDVRTWARGNRLLAGGEREVAVGQWGARWLEILTTDPAYVLWATAKLVDPDLLPDRTVAWRVRGSSPTAC
jgi:hypothetical protein